jgi:UDP-N-acetylglucosamine 2-epimerase (non-hydrolysing)
MKVVTILGTRPEIIRLSRVMAMLDAHCDHVVVHTGQNYEESLSDLFLRDLRVRTPDVHLQIRARTFGEQFAQIIVGTEAMLEKVRPDALLVLGDTNSALSAVVAARRGIPVFHMEAGNRCYDDRVPEEINRRIVDHSSSFLLPYSERSKENLVREGFERERIFVTGNPLYEVLETFRPEIEASSVLERLGLTAQGYFLATIHRAENVDDPERLERLLSGLELVAEAHDKPVIVSVHPRTASRLKGKTSGPNDRVRLLEPFGFFDFVRLETEAAVVLSDSGTVQEECAIFRVPNVTLRDVTERPETIECGSNILAGADPQRMLDAVKLVLETGTDWIVPPEYEVSNVSRTVAKIILGLTQRRRYGASVR